MHYEQMIAPASLPLPLLPLFCHPNPLAVTRCGRSMSMDASMEEHSSNVNEPLRLVRIIVSLRLMSMSLVGGRLSFTSNGRCCGHGLRKANHQLIMKLFTYWVGRLFSWLWSIRVIFFGIRSSVFRFIYAFICRPISLLSFQFFLKFLFCFIPN